MSFSVPKLMAVRNPDSEIHISEEQTIQKLSVGPSFGQIITPARIQVCLI